MSLWQLTRSAGALPRRWLHAKDDRVCLGDLQERSPGGPDEDLRSDVVLLLSTTQLATVIALLELDGAARRIVLCPPDLDSRHLPAILSGSEATAFVADAPRPDLVAAGLRRLMSGNPAAPCPRDRARVETEWVLLTSGTTGRPKMVVHTLPSLIGAIEASAAPDTDVVWSTFYDIRRYGGLQILLRALVGGGSMVLSSGGEAAKAFLDRASAASVSHMSGTPTHWRNAILGRPPAAFRPRYVRLSGETADQAILDKLSQLFPDAVVAHAFASTEAGVAFDVRDGRAGVPVALMTSGSGGVELRVQEGTLRIRSPRTALRYLGDAVGPLADADGFVDTKDVLELRDERYHFLGRGDGVINVGGFKVHPEEVEAVINRLPGIERSLVRGRRNPMTGAIVVADVVLDAHPSDPRAAKPSEAEIVTACRDMLPWYKVPATIRFVPALDISVAGKLVRAGA